MHCSLSSSSGVEGLSLQPRSKRHSSTSLALLLKACSASAGSSVVFSSYQASCSSVVRTSMSALMIRDSSARLRSLHSVALISGGQT